MHISCSTPLAMSLNDMHLVISSNHLDELILSIMYNFLALLVQVRVWSKLSKLSRLGAPWVIIGDFNAIRLEAEHRGGNFNHYAAKSNYFNDFINFNNLFDLVFSRPSFTWCNG